MVFSSAFVLGKWRPGVVHCHDYIVWCISVRFNACRGAFECFSMQKLDAFTCQAVCFARYSWQGQANPQPTQGKAHASDKHCFMHLVKHLEIFFTKRPCMLQGTFNYQGSRVVSPGDWRSEGGRTKIDLTSLGNSKR